MKLGKLIILSLFIITVLLFHPVSAVAQNASEQCAIEKFNNQFIRNKNLVLDDKRVVVTASFDGEIKCLGNMKFSEDVKTFLARWHSSIQTNEDAALAKCNENINYLVSMFDKIEVRYIVLSSGEIEIVKGSSWQLTIKALEGKGIGVSDLLLPFSILIWETSKLDDPHFKTEFRRICTSGDLHFAELSDAPAKVFSDEVVNEAAQSGEINRKQIYDRIGESESSLPLTKQQPAVISSAGTSFEDGNIALEKGDYVTALKVWVPLADQGNADAQFKLGTMYAKGEGLSQDYLQAYLWLNQAAAEGNARAVEFLETLSKHMTPDQIAVARQLATEWKAAHKVSGDGKSNYGAQTTDAIKKQIYDRIVGDREVLGGQIVPNEEVTVQPANNGQSVPEPDTDTPLQPLGTSDDGTPLLPPPPGDSLVEIWDTESSQHHAQAVTATLINALTGKVKACYNVPPAARDADISVLIHFLLNPDGSVNGQPEVASTNSDPVFDATARAAISAILECQNYHLPPDQYELWKDNTLDFNPNLLFGT